MSIDKTWLQLAILELNGLFPRQWTCLASDLFSNNGKAK